MLAWKSAKLLERTIRYFIFLYLLCIQAVQFAYSTMPPPMLQCSANNSVTFIEELTSDQREYFWSGTKKNVDGTFEVNVDEAYFGVIERFSKLAETKSSEKESSQKSVALIGVFRESPARSTFIYSTTVGKAMLTRWDFLKDGASICIPSDFMNQEILGGRGSISLAKASGLPKRCMWKANWILKNLSQQYEFYLEDRCPEASSPTLSKAAFLEVLVDAVARAPADF